MGTAVTGTIPTVEVTLTKVESTALLSAGKESQPWSETMQKYKLYGRKYVDTLKQFYSLTSRSRMK